VATSATNQRSRSAGLEQERSVEFALHPQHETSFDSEKQPVQDFKQMQEATWKFVDSLIDKEASEHQKSHR